MSYARACSLDELTEGQPLAVTVEDVPVALVRDAEEVYAIHDECSHASVALSEGDVTTGAGGCQIECWLHGSTFDLRTGKPTTLPAFEPVPVYPVRVEAGDVLVDVSASLNGAPAP